MNTKLAEEISAHVAAAIENHPAPAPVLANVTTAVKQPRRPGRPPKKRPEVAAPDVIGIVQQPRNPDAVMEMVYCTPSIFKKLFTLLKGYEAADVEFIFRPTDIRIVAKDHYGKSTIYAVLDGAAMNLYYCRDTYHVVVKRDLIERVLGGVDKEQIKVGFALKESNFRSILHVIVRDCQYDKLNAYEIETTYKAADEVIPGADDDTDYPLRFTLESKHFKNEITKISKMSPSVTIRKDGSDPLQFTFDEAKKINYQGTYQDPSKIKLQSAILDGDILNTSVVIDYIKPFSNAAIGEEVIIAVDKLRRLSLTTFLDKKYGKWICSVKVFVEIKTYR